MELGSAFALDRLYERKTIYRVLVEMRETLDGFLGDFKDSNKYPIG
jgi:hypothetical protein